MIEIFACQSNIDVISMDLTGMTAIVRIAWVLQFVKHPKQNLKVFLETAAKLFQGKQNTRFDIDAK